MLLEAVVASTDRNAFHSGRWHRKGLPVITANFTFPPEEPGVNVPSTRPKKLIKHTRQEEQITQREQNVAETRIGEAVHPKVLRIFPSVSSPPYLPTDDWQGISLKKMQVYF